MPLSRTHVNRVFRCVSIIGRWHQNNRIQADYTGKLTRKRQSAYCFSSTSSSRPNSPNDLTIFWSPRVVFGGDKHEYVIDSGTIQVNKKTGIIEECFPGETKEEAITRTHPEHKSCIVRHGQDGGKELGNIHSKNVEFVDLSQLSLVDSSEDKISSTMCLSPGLIDVHTHISSLGRCWEGYTTATQAAAAGGITAIIGMPLNSLPPTCSVDIVEQELEEAINRSKLYVDVGLWGGVLPETLPCIDQLSALLEHPNVLGLKAFLSPLPPNAGYQAISPDQLIEVARLCGLFNKPILVHSELMTVKELELSMKQCFPEDGSMDNAIDAHVRSRPAIWEQEAVKVVIEATKYCDMHVVHLSDAIGCLPIIEKAKQNNKRPDRTKSKLTVESCPHYLLLDSSQIQDDDKRVKCFPPIRKKEQREALWKGLLSGSIDMIASDHSPCEPHMRQGTLRNAWGGLTGLQYQLTATWTAAKRIKDAVDESQIAKWWSKNPASLARLPDRGSIEPGKRADFVFWDTKYYASPDSYSREYHRWKGDCFYSSQQLLGRVVGTWLGGERVYDGVNDEILTTRGIYISCQK